MASQHALRLAGIVFGAVIAVIALLALVWYGIYTPLRERQRQQTLQERGPALLHNKKVDLDRYAGRWHEIARKPNPFERGCVDAAATYTLVDEKIEVRNECVRANGAKTSALGRAVSLNDKNTALRVSFAPRWLGSGAAGDYWILHVDDAYLNALVGSPDRQYLWLLSRSPTVANDTLANFARMASVKGFDVGDFARGAQHEQAARKE